MSVTSTGTSKAAVSQNLNLTFGSFLPSFLLSLVSPFTPPNRPQLPHFGACLLCSFAIILNRIDTSERDSDKSVKAEMAEDRQADSKTVWQIERKWQIERVEDRKTVKEEKTDWQREGQTGR